MEYDVKYQNGFVDDVNIFYINTIYWIIGVIIYGGDIFYGRSQ